MRVLILTQWYPPEPAEMLQELAQTLQVNGHEVTVLTGFPNYPSGELYSGYHLRLSLKETIAEVPVVRVPLYPEHSRSAIRRALNYLSFALSCTMLGPFLVSSPDVIFVFHPPLMISLPAYVLSRLWRIPFVYQVQDMWPETLAATGMLNNQRLLSFIGKIAKWTYSKAHTILVISPGFRQNLLKKGVPPEKVQVISNWVDPKTYYRAEPDPQLAQELGLKDKFNVMFAGNLGSAQGLETVIRAAAMLKDLDDLQFVFVGNGVALPRLRDMVQVLNLSNVRFLGRYPSSAMPDLYALAEVLFVHLKKDPLFEITIPHKILAYLGAGKPILAAISGDAANLVTEIGAGITVAPEDSEALAKAVCRLYTMSQEERCAMGDKGYQAAQTTLSRNILANKIEEVLCQALVH